MSESEVNYKVHDHSKGRDSNRDQDQAEQMEKTGSVDLRPGDKQGADDADYVEPPVGASNAQVTHQV